MTFAHLPPLLAEGLVRTTFEWGRIQSNGDWILPIAAFVGLMVFARWMIRRDAAELHPVLGWLLTLLRTLTLFGLLILYLQPQWRSERETVRNSRAMLLIDTSLSMGLTDAESVGRAVPDMNGQPPRRQAQPDLRTAPDSRTSRIAQVASALAETDFLERIRRKHDVVVWQFNEGLDRDSVRSFEKLETDPPAAAAEDADAPDEPPFDWHDFLKPRGSETRLGLALRQLLSEESGTRPAGLIVISDGGQNAGIAPEAAIAAASKAGIPIFTIGIGSPDRPSNVRVSDLIAPARAYPGDRYAVVGYLQSQRMAGREVEVELLSREADASEDRSAAGTGTVVDVKRVTLGADGEAVPVEFELTPKDSGRRILCLRVRDVAQDRNPGDNFREVDIEIVDRKNRVLILAGGPMREYRFVRNQLDRDRTTTIDVLLQTAQPGISQDADRLLDDFPTTREEMFDYDCVLAFDPDWQSLSPVQIDLLEEWVAGQGGGLIAVAGPVFAGRTIGGWIEDPSMKKVRALYPVEFFRRFSSAEAGLYSAEDAQPLDFTREGYEADYLWLDDTATAGRQAWAAFAGVYGFCPVRGPKPGATVLAYFSDPRVGHAGKQPVYFAEQFYGSGRVFFIGSGEMWRLRKVDETYFEQLYTKLIRHVSQGRLLRGSSRGVLLVGQDRYLLGNSVEVRTQLTDVRLDPLDLPQVALQVIHPDGVMQSVALLVDPTRPGTYAGRFSVLKEGAYRLELPIPDSDDERLSRRIQVKVPDLERENPQRNDALLSKIAAGTGGKYYVGMAEAAAQPETAAGDDSLASLLKDQTRTEIVPLAPNAEWEQTWLKWMMYTLCGLLCFEWFVRRLAKLA